MVADEAPERQSVGIDQSASKLFRKLHQCPFEVMSMIPNVNLKIH
jgi:hypothetical protein